MASQKDAVRFFFFSALFHPGPFPFSAGLFHLFPFPRETPEIGSREL